MPEWLTIVIAIVGLIGTILGVLGISGYIGERARYKASKANKKEDEVEAEAHAAEEQKQKEIIRRIFQEEVLPINIKLDNITKEIENIKHNLADNTIGTVTMLRDRMKAILDECRRDDYASTSTKGNWHELYSTYKSLGGNHFKEYVDAWKEELEELPTVPPVPTHKKRTNKKELDNK